MVRNMGPENKAQKKEDLRVTRTKKSVCDALTRLLATKTIDKISIQEITAEAMINRNTFYLHFENIEYFLEYYYKECLDDLRVRLLDFEKKASSLTVDYFNGCVERLIMNINKFSFIYQSLMARSIYTPFYKSVESIISSHIQVMFKTRNDLADTKMLKIVANYYTSGLIGVLVLWMNNRSDISSQDIIEVLSRINSRNFIADPQL